MTYREKALKAILAERQRQEDRWGGGQHHAHADWHLLVSEEVGETAHAILERTNNLPLEITQIAALCMAWLEDMAQEEDDRAKLGAVLRVLTPGNTEKSDLWTFQ